MIEKIIEFSIRNRFIVILSACAVMAWGVYCVIHTPVDAIPDLSENQVIVFTDWMGRSPARNRGPDHLSALGESARAGGRENGSRDQRVQLLDDQHHLRRQRRFLFRPGASARTAELGQHVSARGRHAVSGARRHGPGANLLVHRRRQGIRPGAAAGDPRLVRSLPAQLGARRGPGRFGRRIPDRIPDRRRSEQTPRLRRHAGPALLRRRAVELGGGRPRHSEGQRRISHPRRRLDPLARRHRGHRGRRRSEEGHADLRVERRHGRPRQRVSPQRAGKERQRGGRRRRDDALRRESAGRDQANQGKNRTASRPGCRRAFVSCRFTTARG